MIHLSSINNPVSFSGNNENKRRNTNSIIPAALLMLSLNTGTPVYGDTFVKTDSVEIIDSLKTIKNPTRLSEEELLAAPTPKVKIRDKDTNVGIIVDTKTNKLYRYDESGEVIDGYHVATGKLNRYGKSLTDTGIRRVHHIETYPYKSAPGTKRNRNPKAYGPNILYLTTINRKTGEEEGSNGEFIHGNNDADSIGTYASHGCIRMDNDVIKMFAKEVKKGTLVLIK